MEIRPVLTNKKYYYCLESSILKINDSVFDLSSLPKLKKPTEKNPNPINPDFYKQDEKEYGLLYVNVDQQFMFINNNLMKFYDIDSNGDISLAELKTIIDHMNMPLDQVIKERKAIMDNYIATHGIEAWNKKGCK